MSMSEKESDIFYRGYTVGIIFCIVLNLVVEIIFQVYKWATG